MAAVNAPYAVGVDGCPAGWIGIALDPEDRWRFWRVRQFAELLQVVEPRSPILVDMPLGLLDGPGERGCDVAARRLLGRPRASSVFSPPARATLLAADYAEALAINRRCQGKGLSKQAWNLGGKIRELDGLMRERSELHGRLRESHPELCFWSLNGGRAMAYNKREPRGRQERIDLLARYLPEARDMIAAVAAATLRRQVALDDIVDALVLAVTARMTDELKRVPAAPVRDGCGIAMEIVYATPANVT